MHQQPPNYLMIRHHTDQSRAWRVPRRAVEMLLGLCWYFGAAGVHEGPSGLWPAASCPGGDLGLGLAQMVHAAVGGTSHGLQVPWRSQPHGIQLPKAVQKGSTMSQRPKKIRFSLGFEPPTTR